MSGLKMIPVGIFVQGTKARRVRIRSYWRIRNDDDGTLLSVLPPHHFVHDARVGLDDLDHFRGDILLHIGRNSAGDISI